MKITKWLLLLMAALSLSGCASGNVLARYQWVSIPPHGRVAFGVNITAKKMQYAFHTSRETDRVWFAELAPSGSLKPVLLSSTSGAGDPLYHGINVFEFANPSNHRITVYFNK
jgi:hypothetical protein